MSVDDLVYSLDIPEMYEFNINGAHYDKQGDIPDTLLTKNVSVWQVEANKYYTNLYCLTLWTWDYIHSRVAEDVLSVGFSDEQIKCLIASGNSLSTIVDMVLSMDTVIEAYSKHKYNKHQIRKIVYEIYANRLIDDLNEFIQGIENKEDE